MATQKICLADSPPQPALRIISINIEGFSRDKAEILSSLCQNTRCDILCVQETHRDACQSRPYIPGLSLTAEICHPKHGNAVFVAPGVSIKSTQSSSTNGVEIITVDTGFCTVSSVYKPPHIAFGFDAPENLTNHQTKVIIGDFNSHSVNWGYKDTNTDGQAVEEWAEQHDLTLIHNPKDPPSFSSGRWRRGYNPDLMFVSANISRQCRKTLCQPIPRTQHRPIMCSIEPIVRPIVVPFKRRFNYWKANWEKYATNIDESLSRVPPEPQNYDQFVDIVARISRKCIPRGCRSHYIPGLSTVSAELLREYERLYNSDPFSSATIEAGERLLTEIGESRRNRWMETVTGINLTHNSKKAWSTIRKLTSDTPQPISPGPVTANQVAHQLLSNGKPTKRLNRISREVHSMTAPESTICSPFALGDIVSGIRELKRGKASGTDNISVEQIQHFGPVAVSWLLALFNSCMASARIPRQWRKAKVIAIPKPGKPTDDPKSFRPISLLCHTLKLFERMLLNRLAPAIDPKLIPEQAGFRPGKSCCSQILNLTQHIEDGFETRKVTGVVFVDLTAAYDTVNIRRMLWKTERVTGDRKFVEILGELLQNRSFQVHLHSEKSRWRRQKNGLPQGSVLAPILFNIYTNDQPASPHTTRFLYADDLALTSQGSFEEVETNLSGALEQLGVYYDENALKPNPSKTQSCIFHLNNGQANRELSIQWRGAHIKHCRYPKYLGVTLDRSLTFRKNCENTKQKVCARNNLLKKLTTTDWGASPRVLRTSGLALCYSAGEFACPVWCRSTHAKLVDTALNETCRIITGCLKPTPVRMLYPLAGIPPPNVRRDVASSVERSKLQTDQRHPLHDHLEVPQRLKSRRSFCRSVAPNNCEPPRARINLWKARCPPPTPFAPLSESLPPGHDLPWPVWKSLNRLRTQVGRSKDNCSRWGLSEAAADQRCECGQDPQTMAHLLECAACSHTCTPEELMSASEDAIRVAAHWANII